MDPGLALALIPIAGITCLWVADRLGIPAILLLLPTGVALGPVTGMVEPEELFGEAFFPGVSLAVAVLLFEGGLGLRFDQLGKSASVVARLVTVGVGVTFLIGAVAVAVLLDTPRDVTLVLAAVLVVSGPTVVGPILALVRPREPTRSVLQWEGIVIDPVGATLAVLMLEVATAGEDNVDIARDILSTVGAGVVVGAIGATAFHWALRRHWIADRLQAAVSFGVLAACYAAGEGLRDEAGLFAATTLGVLLANQRRVTIAHIAGFNEVLGQLLLAGLFITLGANVDLDALSKVVWPALGLTTVLVLVARPLVVAISTIGSPLATRDRLFMAWMAPRGIVAAAVSALFALSLEQNDIDASMVAPTTFVVIVATVALYGLTAKPVAHLLGVSRAAPKGLALIGAPAWALDLADELWRQEVSVLVVTADAEETDAAVARGLPVYQGGLDHDELAEAVESIGARQVLAVADRDELNELGVERLAELVGRANLFALPSGTVAGPRTLGRNRAAMGRHPFDDLVDRRTLADRRAEGWTVVTVDPAELDDDEQALPLVRVATDGTPSVLSDHVAPHRSDRVVALVPPP